VVPPRLREERARFRRSLRVAGGEQRIACLLEPLDPPVVRGSVKRRREPEEDMRPRLLIHAQLERLFIEPRGVGERVQRDCPLARTEQRGCDGRRELPLVDPGRARELQRREVVM
jgi:hypothetical protein